MKLKDIVLREAKVCMAISVAMWLVSDLNFNPNILMKVFTIVSVFLYGIGIYLQIKEY